MKNSASSKKEVEKEVSHKNFKVAIFGSSRIRKGNQSYNQIRELARRLGEREMDVITGGGPGLMQAASEGHKYGSKNKRTHTIGLAIRLLKKQKPNEYLEVLKQFSRFSSRLDNFMLLSNAIVVAPGGVGTLLEFFYTWQLVQTEQICSIPIILLGEQWPDLFKWVKKYPLKNKYLEKEDINVLFMAKNIDEVLEIIDMAYKDYKRKGKNFCLNYKKYKLS